MLRILSAIIVLLFVWGCKNDSKEEKPVNEITPTEVEKVDSLRLSERDIERQQQMLNLKRRELLEKKDQKAELENLIVSRSFFKEKDNLTLDFDYPFLNEQINARYSNFNDYIKKNFVDSEGIEAKISDEKRVCDSLGIVQGKERRTVEYKLFNLNDRLISVLFYTENLYSGAAHPSYTFETLNYDLQTGEFMNFQNFFNPGTEEEVAEILNTMLQAKINSGDMYYDCWNISDDDFLALKSNFVISDDVLEYYFDDCVICPSYTGTYSVAIPLDSLKPVLRNDRRNPLRP